jgi:hypothetical protein
MNDNKPAENTAVEFKPYHSKSFGKSEAATLRLSVPDADALFIILILVYSEVTTHPPVSFGAKLSHNLAIAIASG